MAKRRNLIILGGLAAIIIVTLVMNLGVERKDRTEVTVDEVERGTLVAKVSGPGRVRAETTVQISSSVMGRVIELAVEEGDAVKKGDLVLRRLR